LTKPVLLAAIWSLFLLASCLNLSYLLRKFPTPSKFAWLWIILIALFARLIPNMILPMGAEYDIESFRIAGSLILQREDVYASPLAIDRHPYLPLQMYWMAFAVWLAESLHLPYVTVVRLLPILADLGVALLLFQIMRSRDELAAFQGALWYALNPIPVFVSAYHGQFDALPILLMMVAYFYLGRTGWVSGTWLGFAILAKSWPVLALPALIQGARTLRAKGYLLLFASLVPLLGVIAYSIVFKADVWNVLTRALSYNRGVGVYGYTYLFRLLSALDLVKNQVFEFVVNYGRFLTLVILGLVWIARARKEAPAAGILTVLITFFAVTHAFAIQYLGWLIPFGILNSEYRWLKWYCLAAYGYMSLVYFTLILDNSITRLLPWPQADLFIIIPASIPVWLVCLAWILSRMRASRMQSGEVEPAI
jgi:hypothetical protein